MARAADAAEHCLDHSVAEAMNRFNGRVSLTDP